MLTQTCLNTREGWVGTQAIKELHNFRELFQPPDNSFQRLAQRTCLNYISQQHKYDL